MQRFVRLTIVFIMLAALLPAGLVSAQPARQIAEPTSCLGLGGLDPATGIVTVAIPGIAPSGSQTCITLPTGPNAPPLIGLVIFAHGYVFAIPENEPVDIPWDQLTLRDPATGALMDTLPRLLNSLGFVFATTSYPKNGLAVREGVASVVELVQVVVPATLAQLGMPLPADTPFPVFLIGASEGGLVTTLAVEQRPDLFAGGVAACGPVGDFRKQINYWGDFRVVFDYYFGNLLGTNPVSIPEAVMTDWTQEPSAIQDAIRLALAADLQNNRGIKVSRLLTAAAAPVDPGDPTTIEKTVLGILEYNVLATNEAIVELGNANPFDNTGKKYVAVPFDPRLNRKVTRVAADPAALTEIANYYQTSGSLMRPLVLLHTTGDPIVPFWHTSLYLKKVIAKNSLSKLAAIPIFRYGHCQFKPEEALLAFEVMVIKAQMQAFSAQQVEQALPDARSRKEFQKIKEEHKDKYR